jgi:N-acetylglucosamine-6-sulfatase
MLLSCNSKEPARLNLPNFIFIITDDQQCGLLGAEGNTIAQTSNIDRIAREGMVFNNFFVCTPLCSPSRASFLTGQYTRTHGVINNDRIGLDVTSHTLMTWPRQLREAGYETAFIGKWHMGLDDSRRPGFDRWVSFKGQGIFVDGVVNDEGKIRQIDGNMTDFLNEKAVEFVNQDHQDKPFAMILSHKALHVPIIPSEKHQNDYPEYRYTKKQVARGDVESKPVLSLQVEWKGMYGYDNVVPEPPEPRRGRGYDETSIIGDQLRCLNDVDEGIGKIFQALEQNNLLENTIIIYTSDNGMLMGEHGQFHKKRWAYDETIRVPFFIRYPKLIKKGSKRDQMVLNIDLAPTIYEIAGVEPLIPIHGQSFLPLLNSVNVNWRNTVFIEYFHEKVASHVPAWKAIRTENWKYIKYDLKTEDMNELYDLENDPKEERNLIHDPAYQDQLEKLKSELKAMEDSIDHI